MSTPLGKLKFPFNKPIKDPVELKICTVLLYVSAIKTLFDWSTATSDGRFSIPFPIILKKEPLGLCGSGMLDLIAEMLASRIMDKRGKLDKRYGKEFFLDLGRDISVTESEIEYFMNSKAAIFATVRTVLQESGLSQGDLDVIYIAGGFGNMNFEKAQLIGLLPPSDKYRFVGNTSLKGAQHCLRQENLARAELIAQSSTPLTLTESVRWMEHYTASRFFPHTDTALFSRVLARYSL